MSGTSKKSVSAIDEYASPELSASVKASWRGYVDQWNSVDGIRGWALETACPQRSVKLELVVNDVVIEVAETFLARPDIEVILGVRVKPGFRFSPTVFSRLARLGSSSRDFSASIRIADTAVRLPPEEILPSVGTLVDAWKVSVLNSRRTQTANASTAEMLVARLATLRTQAEAYRELPLRPHSESEVGRIDALYVTPKGEVWLAGWMKRGSKVDFPAIIVDRVKFPAGASLLTYERQDLSSNCVGVIGVLDTDWTPPLISHEFFIYIGDGARQQLRVGVETEVLRIERFLSIWQQATRIGTGGNADLLGALLNARTSWVPDGAAAAGISAEAAVDQILVLPGFGCIVEGWAISPAKRIRTFEMKIGESLLVAEEASTYFRPRPDLENVWNGRSSLYARAGFVTVLRGSLPDDSAGAPLLRVVHDDGTSAVHRLDQKLVQLLDPVADSTQVLRLYPSLRHEPFYPPFVETIRRRLSARVAEPLGLRVAPSSHVVVIRLPASRNNLALCFDEIAERADHLPVNSGICLVADRTLGLGEAKMLFEELRAAVPVPLSLFCVEDVFDGFDQLPLILGQLGAERFVYVGRGLLLTERGWASSARSLLSERDDVEYFEIIDESGGPDRIYGARSADCFGWSVSALLNWLPSAPRFLHGVYGTSGLPDADSPLRELGAVIRVERPPTSRLAEIVDEDILTAAKGIFSAD